uniref:glutathione transferase n=1 Tax=Setaria viridis TaxID=4556 RepID=A0A4U6UEU7_SETVI|nr:glutathione S-transferase 4-like [Setaria viridis]TKW14438.1 hypothetical protein SEVIR_5G168350v2 [Setaria viridis]
MDGARAGVPGRGWRRVRDRSHEQVSGDHRRPEHLARNNLAPSRGTFSASTSRSFSRKGTWRGQQWWTSGWKWKPTTWSRPCSPSSGTASPARTWGASDQAVVDESLGKLRALLPVYEARLLACKYLAGDDVTAADLCHFGFMRYFMATEYAGVVDAYPHIKAWWDALLARPSVKKVIAGMPPDFGYASGNIP